MAEPAPPLAATGWSSSLSTAEAAAVREAGFEARGLVMGSSVYRLGVNYSPAAYYSTYGGAPWGGGPWAGAPRGYGGGWGRGSFPGWVKYYNASELGYGGGWAAAPGQFGGWGYGAYALAVCWERTVFEDGVEAAAHLAVERMVQETRALGGHGVVAVRLAFRYLEGFASTIEFTALGTAVARRGAAPLAEPFTSHLDGQALLKLIGAGLVPVTVAVGAGSVTAEMPRTMLGAATRELGPFGDAIESSRRIAADRLRRDRRAKGWAVIGTLASTGQHAEGEGEVATTVLTGTVVRRFAAGSWSHLPLPVMRLSRP